MTTKEVLMNAASIVERGWCQDRYNDGDRSCAKGAIYRAAREARVDFLPVLKALAAVLPQGDPELLCPIALWNDAPERTQAEVVAAMRQAAEAI
jgi:hypothetical protein